MDTAYEQHLIMAGLARDEARAYETLVKMGGLQAGDLGRHIQISSRPLMYKVLDDLITKGLVEKKEDPGKVAKFFATHPLRLREYTEKEKTRAEQSIIALEGVIGKLTSDFNLTSGKPGVRFFEGKAGMKAVLDDSLTAHGVIDTYTDIESMEKYIHDINAEYSKQREKFGIKKRGIVPDTPFNRAYLSGYHTSVTNTKFIKLSGSPFHTVMQIYDGKVSYLTLRDENMIGAIIEDPNIYAMHKTLFEHTWSTTPEIVLPSPKALSPTPQFEEL